MEEKTIFEPLEPDTSVLLRDLTEQIDKVKFEDLELQKQESEIKKRRDELKLEILRLGNVLKEAGLEEFRTSNFTLKQGETHRYSLSEVQQERIACIEFLKNKGLFTRYVKVDGRSIGTIYREFLEQGEPIPGIKEYTQWECKITKG